MKYQKIIPNSSYAPWLEDNLFLQYHSLISNHTLVDIYRCYELWSLVEQSHHIPGDIIEVGVWRGGTGAMIAKKADLLGGKSVYLCDTFTGVVKAGGYDPFYNNGMHADADPDTVCKLLTKTFNLSNYYLLEGIFPDQTSIHIRNKICFAHIDVDVYQSAKDSVEWIWPRLSVGGIIVYDDYAWESCPGITRFVNEQLNTEDRVIIHNLNGHAICVKIH
jgi:O-methyltransferase